MLSVKCCGSGAFQFLPEKKLSLDLKSVVQGLSGYELTTSTRYILILHRDGLQLSLTRDGRLLVQKATSIKEAEKAAELLYSSLGLL